MRLAGEPVEVDDGVEGKALDVKPTIVRIWPRKGKCFVARRRSRTTSRNLGGDGHYRLGLDLPVLLADTTRNADHRARLTGMRRRRRPVRNGSDRENERMGVLGEAESGLAVRQRLGRTSCLQGLGVGMRACDALACRQVSPDHRQFLRGQWSDVMYVVQLDDISETT